MKFKFLIYIILISTTFFKNGFAEEIQFNSSNIKVLDEGNIINALNVDVYIPKKKKLPLTCERLKQSDYA